MDWPGAYLAGGSPNGSGSSQASAVWALGPVQQLPGRNTVLYPKSVHIVQLRLVWLDIWCENSLAVCSRGMPASLAVWAAPGG